MVFEFVSGIEESLANKLQAIGIIVKGDTLPDSHPIEDSDDSWNADSSDNESVHER